MLCSKSQAKQRILKAGIRIAPILALALPPAPLEAQNGPPLRIAYLFQYGSAYTAKPDVPLLDALDLGPGCRPLGANSSAEVLLAEDSGDLVLWQQGRRIRLMPADAGWREAWLNERGQICCLQGSGDEAPPKLLFWDEAGAPPRELAWGAQTGRAYYASRIKAFNDAGDIILTATSESIPAFAPSDYRTETLLLEAPSHAIEQLALQVSTVNEEWAHTESGELWTVSNMNNLGHQAGLYQSWSASSGPFLSDWINHWSTEYVALNRFIQLPFEVIALNDEGSLFGRSLGPSFAPLLLDKHGLRDIGPPFPELERATALMNNPEDGLEEIVVGNHYWKRMSARDSMGLSTGQPAADFWQGTLAELLRIGARWEIHRGTALADNGLLACTGTPAPPALPGVDPSALLLVPALAVPDLNRDGSVDTLDKALARKGFPWHLWINDDNDDGDLARSAKDDLPDGEDPDHARPGVDGLRDEIDFFPLCLDLVQLLEPRSDLNGIEVLLVHPESALNVVYTSLEAEDIASRFEEPIIDGCGPQLLDPFASAPTHPVTADGLPLSQTFLRDILSRRRGVLLLEGTRATREPLRVIVRAEGTSLAEVKLPLSVSPVRDMLRILNLRKALPKATFAETGPWESRLSDPPGLPDTDLLRLAGELTSIVHIHGFNWTADLVPATHSEVFKRLYQSGSMARFIGVTWLGDQGIFDWLGTSFDYNENVINAFLSASYLKAALADFWAQGASILAHSLGNMVACSAIVDHGILPKALLMLNAAIPAEAFAGEFPERRLMVNPDWKNLGSDPSDYPEHLLSTHWSQLFPTTDHRSDLSWKSRFEAAASACPVYHFYSPAEDVLRPGDGTLPNLFTEVMAREYVWTYNEMVKGTFALASSLTGDIHGGWGFNRAYMNWSDPGGPARPPTGDWVALSAEQAGRITAAELRAEPFFRRFSGGDEDFPYWGDGDWLHRTEAEANQNLPPVPFASSALRLIANHAKILAEAIPAHSAPAGASLLEGFPLLHNLDLDLLFRDPLNWPLRGSAKKDQRWLHSDFMNTALNHSSRFFKYCTLLINP